MVIMRSFQFEIVLVAITAGIAHATLDISVTTLFPFNQKGRIKRSIINTTLAKYPVSSKIAMKKKSSAI